MLPHPNDTRVLLRKSRTTQPDQLTDEQVLAYKQGLLTIANIEALTSASYLDVRAWLHNRGISTAPKDRAARHNSSRPNPLTPSDISDYHAKLTSLRKLGTKHKVSRTTIAKWLREKTTQPEVNTTVGPQTHPASTSQPTDSLCH